MPQAYRRFADLEINKPDIPIEVKSEMIKSTFKSDVFGIRMAMTILIIIVILSVFKIVLTIYRLFKPKIPIQNQTISEIEAK